MARAGAPDATIAPYVSSLSDDAYALRGVPEDVIAELLASAPGDVRARLVEMVRSVPPGASWAVTAQRDRGEPMDQDGDHAFAHLVIEQVSLIAARAIEDARLVAVTVADPLLADLAPVSVVEPPELDEEGLSLYRAGCARLLAVHAGLLAKLGSRGAEAARGLLPSGARTTVAVSGNARSLGALFSKLLSHPFGEVRRAGQALLDAARAVLGPLLEGIGPSSLRASLAPAVAQALRRVYAPPEGAGATAVISQPIRIVRYEKDAHERIALALAYDGSDGRVHASGVIDAFRFATASELVDIVRSPLAARGPGDPVPRAFAAASITVELMVDGVTCGALSRCRSSSPSWQQPSCRLGFETPRELVDAAVSEPYQDALIAARETWAAVEQLCPMAAPYVVPLAYRLRGLWTLDLRELVDVVERASARSRPASVRRIAHGLHRAATSTHPWLSDVVRCDLDE